MEGEVHTVRVNAGQGYYATIGPGLLDRLGLYLEGLGTEAVIVTDENVGSLYLDKVLSSIKKAGSYTIPAGERYKNLETVSGILDYFGEFGLTRSGFVVALGGGVIGDMAGFAAGIWLRGVPAVQLPTTLLAMVDSSVGGKTGVDLPCGKNLAGMFHQPEAVIADTDMLKTLPEAEIRNGTAEILKAGIIGSPGLFSRISAEPSYAVSPAAIAESVGIKAGIAERDVFETGERKLLNLGHTAGHAIELLSSYEIPHGAAVAMGMAMAAEAGTANGLTEKQVPGMVKNALEACGLETEPPFPIDDIVECMSADKKRRGGEITLVIPERIGNCVLHKVKMEELPDFWKRGRR